MLDACAFRRPDRIPCFDTFWEYPDSWRARFGPPELLTDIEIRVPDETPFPSRARRMRVEDGGVTEGGVTEVNGWGATVRSRPGTYFSETLAVPIPEGTDPDTIVFEDPSLDSRYPGGAPEGAAGSAHCLFSKTGGPYLRTTFVRGEEQFLRDMAGDPGLARALAEKVADHLTAVGCEEIRRWGLADTGIWIYDDMACNRGPMFSPRAFETVLLPAYRRMIAAYRGAGARYILLHSDGDIRPLLDMLVDAGIDSLNPLERRAGMAIEEIRKLFPRLILVGGMCNTDTLVNGPARRVREEALRSVEMGRDGGVIIGTHSVSPEIPLEYVAAYREVCETHGRYR